MPTKKSEILEIRQLTHSRLQIHTLLVCMLLNFVWKAFRGNRVAGPKRTHGILGISLFGVPVLPGGLFLLTIPGLTSRILLGASPQHTFGNSRSLRYYKGTSKLNTTLQNSCRPRLHIVFPGGASQSASNARGRRHAFDPSVGKIPLEE